MLWSEFVLCFPHHQHSFKIMFKRKSMSSSQGRNNPWAGRVKVLDTVLCTNQRIKRIFQESHKERWCSNCFWDVKNTVVLPSCCVSLTAVSGSGWLCGWHCHRYQQCRVVPSRSWDFNMWWGQKVVWCSDNDLFNATNVCKDASETVWGLSRALSWTPQWSVQAGGWWLEYRSVGSSC